MCPFTYLSTAHTNYATETEVKVVGWIKLDYQNDHNVHIKLYFKRIVLTLRNGSRLNGFYETKIMAGIIICHIKKNAVVKSH